MVSKHGYQWIFALFHVFQLNSCVITAAASSIDITNSFAFAIFFIRTLYIHWACCMKLVGWKSSGQLSNSIAYVPETAAHEYIQVLSDGTKEIMKLMIAVIVCF
jgi:hypothetical protein